MNRRSLLKFLVSAPAAMTVGLGTLVGKKKARPYYWSTPLPEGTVHDLETAAPYAVERILPEYKQVSPEEEQRIFAAMNEMMDNITWDD